MKKIICIGECAMDIIFDEAGQPMVWMPGGRIANAAALMAAEELPVIMASEAAADAVGDSVVAYLAKAGVKTAHIDRFTEGRTPLTVFMPAANGALKATRYEQYADDCFDIVWPRVDEGDIVLFGGYYAIDARMRRRMLPLLQHAAERKAILVYLPGYLAQQEPRITRVMPAILENLELASLVCTRTADLMQIFNTEDAESAFRNHVEFYQTSMLNVDTRAHRITFHSGRGASDSLELPMSDCTSLAWNAGVAAGAAGALLEAEASVEMLANAPAMLRREVLRRATATADIALAAAPPFVKAIRSC